jgi:hypothetical protein
MASNHEKYTWRLIAICGFSFCLFAVIKDLIISPVSIAPTKDIIGFKVIIAQNIGAMGGFLYLIFFPMNFSVYALFSLVYAITITVDGGNAIGFFMFMLYVAFAHRSGFFVRRAKTKLLCSTVVYIAAFISQIRYGPEIMLRNLLEIMALTGIIALGVYACFKKIEALYARILKKTDTEKASPSKSYPVNLDDPGLSARDRDFLHRVIAGEK